MRQILLILILNSGFGSALASDVLYTEIILPKHSMFMPASEVTGPFRNMKIKIRMDPAQPQKPWIPKTYLEAANELPNMLPESYLNYLLFRYGMPGEVAKYDGPFLDISEDRTLDVSAYFSRIWPIDDLNTQLGREFECMGNFEFTHTAFYYSVAFETVNNSRTELWDQWMDRMVAQSLQNKDKMQEGNISDSDIHIKNLDRDVGYLYQLLRSACLKE